MLKSNVGGVQSRFKNIKPFLFINEHLHRDNPFDTAGISNEWYIKYKMDNMCFMMIRSNVYAVISENLARKSH